MSDKKNIDRLFQEKLKDFEAIPSDAVWENIQNTLHNKKERKRRIIPIWWQLGGIAAAIVLILTLSGVFNPSEDKEQPINTIVDTEQTDENLIKASENNTTIEEPQLVNSEENTSTNFENPSKNTSTSRPQNSPNINTSVANSSLKTTLNKQNNTTTQNNPVKESVVNSHNNTNKETQHPLKNNSDVLKKEELKELINTSKAKTSVTETSSEENNDSNNSSESNLTEELKENALAEAKKEDNDTIEEEEETLKSRWSVSPNVAPVYFNTLGNGSSIHDQFNNNTKSGDINMSYGVSGSYAINNKLKVRAGINKVDLGYSTNDVIVYNNPQTIAGFGLDATQNNGSRIDNITFKNNTANTSILSTPSTLSLDTAPDIIKENAKASLDQQFGFIEIPIELEYTVVNKRLGVNLIGGFSTLFLNNNDIYAVTREGERTLIGEANNINNTSYSANFGIGINYGLSNKFNINLEPMFKYQINTFTNTSGDFQPYFIGVYTGLSFKF